MSRDRVRRAAPTLLYMAALTAIVTVALHHNRDALFWSLDGYVTRQLSENEISWFRNPFAFGLDPLRGPGSFFIPINYLLSPPLALQALLSGGSISRVLAYAGYALELIGLTAWLAHVCGVGARRGALAGFLAVFLTMPIVWAQETTLVFPLFVLSPIYHDVQAAALLFVIAFAHVGRVSTRASVGYAALCLLAVVWFLAEGALWIVLIVPFVGLAVAAMLILASGSERLAKLSAIASILLILLVAGLMRFAYSAMTSTAANFFSFEIESYQFGRWWSSFVYQYDRFPVSASIAALGIASAAVLAVVSWRKRESMLLTAMASATALVGLGLVVAWRVIEPLPILASQLRHVRLFYFEVPALPLYCLFVVVVVSRVIALLIARPRLSEAVLSAIVAVFMGAVGLVEVHKGRSSNPWKQPVLPTPMTDFLAGRVAVQPGSTFAGRVATIFLPDPADPGPGSWDRMVAHDVTVYARQQNDHRFVGLWAFNIPTLQEYTQVLNPATYFWVTRTLSTAADKQDMRNHALMTTVNVPILKLLGVRYVIASQPIARAGLTLQPVSAPGRDLLYEVGEPNVGQYFAARTRRVATFADALRQMGTTESLLKTTWVHEDVPQTLAPGDTRIEFLRSGIRVRGQSEGTALMVLPFAYSRCFDARVNAGDPNPRLLRADLSLLGLLFSRSVDVTLRLQTGVATNSQCLAADARELRALGLVQAAHDFPRGSLTAP